MLYISLKNHVVRLVLPRVTIFAIWPNIISCDEMGRNFIPYKISVERFGDRSKRKNGQYNLLNSKNECRQYAKTSFIKT